MFVKVPAIAALLCACGALVACSSAPKPSPSPSARAVLSLGGSASATPAPTSADNSAAVFDISAADIPSSTYGAFSQVSDGLLAGHQLTDQRTFANPAGSVVIECDVIVEQANTAVSGDYSQARTAARSRVTALSSSGNPNVGGQADEFAGTTSAGKGIVAITFVRSLTVDAVLVETSGTPDTAFAEQLATALDTRIQSQG